MRTRGPPNTADTSENDQTGRITLESAKWRLCGIPHNRHRVAVNTLIDWYRSGVNVDERMPTLSTYLGHVSPSDTYWYLSASPELMALAADRLADRFGGAR